MSQKSEWRRRAEVLFQQGLSVDEVIAHPQVMVFINDNNRQSIKDKLYMVRKKIVKVTPSKPVQSFASTASFADIKREVMPQSYNPFNLPEPEDDSAKVFTLPVADNNIGLLNDIHCPFHDMLALTTAIKSLKERRVNTVYLNGDIIDFYSISRFMKDKKLRNLANELDKTREFLKVLRDIFSDCRIYYKIGNHDARWDHYIASNAGEFEGMEEFTLSYMLRLPKLNIQVVDSSTRAKAGHLNILHGHEIFGSGGVNPARALFLKTGSSVIQGHVHRTAEHSEPDLDGKLRSCWSVGCLSDLRPKYNPNSKYNHGFAHIETDSSGHFHVDNKKIFNGKIL